MDYSNLLSKISYAWFLLVWFHIVHFVISNLATNLLTKVVLQA